VSNFLNDVMTESVHAAERGQYFSEYASEGHNLLVGFLNDHGLLNDEADDKFAVYVGLLKANYAATQANYFATKAVYNVLCGITSLLQNGADYEAPEQVGPADDGLAELLQTLLAAAVNDEDSDPDEDDVEIPQDASTD